MQQLPVISTVKDAIGYTFSNMTLLIRASMVWVALYIVVVSIFSFSGGEAFMQVFVDFGQNAALSNADNSFAIFDKLFADITAIGSIATYSYIALIVISILAYYGIAIAWHRACLLDEQPPLFRLGGLEFKYLFMSFLLAIILYILFIIVSMIAGFIIGFALSGAGNENMATIGIAVTVSVVGLVCLLAFGRFSLAFPGIAVRDRRMNLRTSFKATKGNSWRILGGTLLCIIPALVIALIMGLVDGIGLPIIIAMPIFMILNLFSGAFILSYMSICYQILVPSPDAGDLA